MYQIHDLHTLIYIKNIVYKADMLTLVILVTLSLLLNIRLSLKTNWRNCHKQAARPPAHSFTNHTTSTGDWTTNQLKTGSIPNEWVSPDSSL